MNSTHSASTTDPIVRTRMPELDTLRGIAILAVFVFHGFEETIGTAAVARPVWQRAILTLMSQGWAGVNLFFVLSGFLITGILLDSRTKPRYYSRFYSHRALRILPAYYLLLLILFILGRTGIQPGNGLGAFLGLSFIYLSNLAPMFGVRVFYWPLWSLAVEEHFYLLWPTVVKLLTKRSLAIAALLICLVEPLLRLVALHAGAQVPWGGLHRIGSFRYTWMTADGLALGALLAIFARSAWGSRENLLKLAGIAAAGTAVAEIVSLFANQTLAYGLRGTLVNYGALAMIAGSLWLGTGIHRGWTNIRLLSFYGYISYGLYLIHYLVIELCGAAYKSFLPALAGADFGLACLRFAIALPIATAIAYLSRITYEEYFLRMKDRYARPRVTVSSPETA
jgi:peptidoglycan/LPS O-acetylase OafA/YrhL